MKKYYVLYLFLFSCIQLWAQRPFITEWFPTKNIITNNYEIKIVTDTTLYAYNYNITWENLTIPGLGNGSASSVTGNLTITVPYNLYKISITGNFPYIRTNSEKLRSINQWGDIQWQSFYLSFANHSDLTLQAIDVPDLSQVRTLERMFAGCNLFTGHPSMNNWNTANVQNMYGVFESCKKFNQNISNWNTSNVTIMTLMFAYCDDFNQPLDSWNTSKVTDMSFMFYECTNFNQPIGNWNVSNVTNMSYMFAHASNFNQMIENWDVHNVTNMLAMFYGAFVFNQPLGNWDVINVTDMSAMFIQAFLFNQPIDSWDVTNVKNISSMFPQKFNQPLNSWNTINLEQMYYTFNDSFNQNLSNWKVEKVINATNAFNDASMSIENYDSTLIGWSSQNLRDSVTLGALNKQYCNSVVERKSMIISYKWNFVGDIQSCLTEVEESLESPQILLYPNPNIGSFILQSIENDHYEIYDMHGKRVSEGKIFPGKNAIQVSLASGLYVIKLLEQEKNIKMVVE